MTGPGDAGDKRMRLRYAGTCRVCATELPERAEAIYERATRTVRCLSHDALPEVQDAQPSHPQLAVDPGVPGGSARREFERRRQSREARIREKHPRLGGLILAVTDEPKSTTAWDTGAVGEERLGARLNELASQTLRVLHDRRMPRSRANIDHLAVTPSGVWVIDAKRYAGRPRLTVEGGLLRPRVEKLMVGRRDRTTLVDGVRTQVAAVRALVDPEVPVRGVLCFVEADWPLLGGAFEVRGVDVLSPRKLYRSLDAPGPWDADAVTEVCSELAAAFLPA